MATKNDADTESSVKENERKWTKTLMKAGWTAIPSIILERQQALGLDAVDLNIIMHLAKHWWYAKNLPYPSKSTIAKCMGINARTVQRRIAALEASGLITRKQRMHQIYGRQSNHYDFSGLIKEATPYAQELIQKREENAKEARERKVRKRLLIPAGAEE